MNSSSRFWPALLLTLWSSWAEAQSAEDKLKAAFIYNFAKFITWPATVFDSRPAITVCVLGTSPITQAIAGMQGRSAQGKPIKILNLPQNTATPSCDITFIPKGERVDISAILATSRNTTALTISDVPGFATSGGMIELASEDKRVAFDVNLQELERGGLRVSPQLLKVARTVQVAKR